MKQAKRKIREVRDELHHLDYYMLCRAILKETDNDEYREAEAKVKALEAEYPNARSKMGFMQ